MQDPNANLFATTYRKKPIVIKKGAGSYLLDQGNAKYLDFISGVAFNSLGYENPILIESTISQIKKISHPSNYYYTEAQIELARRLIGMSGLKRVFYANSGAEANEAGLSFLHKYSKIVNKKEVLVFKGSFFGRTYGARVLANGGDYYDLKVRTVPFNNCEELSKAFSRDTLAIALELVLGHGGIRSLSNKTIEAVSALRKNQDVVLLVDEIQTGLGRTGAIFRFQKVGIEPDIVTIGKSLGGGLPLSATLLSERIADIISPGDYGCTMGGNSVACAAGLVLLNTLESQGFFEEVNRKGELLSKKLGEIWRASTDSINEVRCFGLMCGIEVKNADLAEKTVAACFERNLLVDIVNGSTIRLAPPFTIEDDEIENATEILRWAFQK